MKESKVEVGVAVQKKSGQMRRQKATYCGEYYRKKDSTILVLLVCFP